MEEPQELHTEDKSALPEKKHKRILKTREQLAALENFYNEHKYPAEALKLEFAEAVGLTEKQVSGWFCHRRLKDKRLSNGEVQTHGKQDRSSGVIQDLGSGLKQDSCGSTKQGDNKQFEPKEVESKRFTNEGFIPTEIRYEHGIQHNSIIMDMDNDTFSGSSSPLKDHLHSQNMDHSGMVTSKFLTQNDVISVTGRTGPSGYLKVKGQAENAAITAVKRQLGRHYREDGPPLGIEFEQLPPGAFENPTEDPVNQSYYVSDRTALHSLEGSRTFQPSNASKMYGRYNPSMDESGLETRHALKHHEKYSNSQYKQTPRFSKHSQMVVNDDSDDEVSGHDLREQFEPRMKHGPGIRRPDSLSNRHLVAFEKNSNGNQAENYPRSHNIGPPKVNYIDRIEPLTSDLTFKQREFEDRGLSRKTSKVTKRSRDDFMHNAYPRKQTVVDVPPVFNKNIRSAVQMTTSFSDDETAGSASSSG
ncbi:uncharacterized protein [Rutidosis leptorrhynchoides]|uniref:uncharacterized protein isoform X2 n=1 Tax=Rutidosis leptorrhynchoides TaxID=125765 RepID=UPI003A98D764